MELSILLAIVAMLCFGVCDVLFKRGVQNGATAQNVMMVPVVIGAVIALSYAALAGTLHASTGALWALAAGVLIYLSFNLFMRSMKAGAVSIAAPVFRLNFVVTVVLAVVILAEAMSPAKVLGLVFALVAIWLLLAGGSKQAKALTGNALAQLLAATLLVGIGFFLSKMAVTYGAPPATALAAQVGALAVSSVIASLITDRSLAVSPAVRVVGPAIGVIQTVGLAALMHALSMGHASIVAPIAQLSFVVSAILGYLLLREPLSIRKAMGLIAAVGAVAALAYAGAEK